MNSKLEAMKAFKHCVGARPTAVLHCLGKYDSIVRTKNNKTVQLEAKSARDALLPLQAKSNQETEVVTHE